MEGCCVLVQEAKRNVSTETTLELPTSSPESPTAGRTLGALGEVGTLEGTLGTLEH